MKPAGAARKDAHSIRKAKTGAILWIGGTLVDLKLHPPHLIPKEVVKKTVERCAR